jgi:hypothetical protein
VETVTVYHHCPAHESLIQNTELTPCSRLLPEKPTAAQLGKTYPASYGTKSSLPCSHEPVTGLLPEPDKYCPYHHSLIKINFNKIMASTPASHKSFSYQVF